MTIALRPGARVVSGALALAFVTAAFTCEGTVGPVPSGERAPPNDGGGIIVAFGEDLSRYPADDWDLVSGEVEADSLELEIRYPGGCAEHDFWLLAADGWIPLPDAGITTTVGVLLRLPHDAHDDPCEALITRTLRFDLSPLGEAFRREYGAGPARILLQITDGRDGFAIYVFDWAVPPL